MVMTSRAVYVTCPKGIEEILAREIEGILGRSLQSESELPASSSGPKNEKETERTSSGGVAFQGTLHEAYRVCLWSRTATRVLLPIASFDAPTPEKLYGGVRSIRWSDHLAATGTLAVDFRSQHSQMNHSHFGALKTKDAICDQFMSTRGERPSVDKERPDVRVHVYLKNDRAQVSIDLSGESLHLRGYRERQTAAPLKENLAAAVLLACEWPEISAQGGALLDPFCGSGTLVLEAAMMSLDYAPGMLRNYWGFQKWLGHEEAVWNELMKEALDRKKRPQGASTRLKWIGSDEDYSSLKLAERGSEALGIRSLIHWERRELIKVEPPRTLGRADPRGLCVMNPPYGERIGVATQIPALYREIGDFLKKQLPGWRAGILTGSPEGMKSIGLKPTRRIPMWNGPIECRLLTYALF